MERAEVCLEKCIHIPSSHSYWGREAQGEVRNIGCYRVHVLSVTWDPYFRCQRSTVLWHRRGWLV